MQDVNYKSLLRRKSELAAEQAALHAKQTENADTLKTITSKMRDIDSQLSSMQESPMISEHAVLRWLERARGINIEEVKKEILTEKLKTQIDALANGTFPIGNGLYAKVKNKMIVTIVTQP